MSRPRRFFLFGLFVAAVCYMPSSLMADEVARGPRHALVIGNSGYAELSKLKNPANDAADMAAALQALGFQVELLTNADLAAMEDAVVRLGRELSVQADSLGFFFYAGHGIQSDGINYLIPADARIPSESFLKTKALPAQAVLDVLGGARNALNVVVLDACRDNPFSWGRGGARGLTVVGKQPAGSVIAYATSAGSVAADGNGRNGVFTTELLQEIKKPGVEIKEMLNRVGKRVSDTTAGKQIPAVYNQFFESAYLTVAAASTTNAAVPAAPETASGTAATSVPKPSFGTAIAAVGHLSITLATAGTVNVAGMSSSVPAGTVPVNNLAIGQATVTVTYPDGKTETATPYVEAEKTVKVAFTYAPAPKPAPVAATASAPSIAAPAANPGAALRGEIFVKGGTFRMGSDTGESDEKPVHEVRVGDFWMMKTEVTQQDYTALMGSNPANSYGVGDNFPVYNVSWYDAVAYANKLSERDKLRPAYTINGTDVTCDWKANGWRLPTEAEWEFAARGGNASKAFTYAGGNTVDAVAWYDQNAYNKGSGNPDYGTHSVGTKAANELGLYDLSGNVWEWCWDWYGSYTSGSQTDPMGAASGADRVIRGGSWGRSASYARSAYRSSYSPSPRHGDIGFRLLRSSVSVAALATVTVAAPPIVVPTAIPIANPGVALRGEIFVKGGAFRMGSDTGDSDERLVHEVRVSDFWMMKTEVTQQDYTALMGSNPANSYGVGDNFPVYYVSWYDAVAYANKLSERDKLRPAYTINGTNVTCDSKANGWRLPTEAEWEFAARGGNASKGYTYSGSEALDTVAWYSSNSSGTTHPVATKAANELGLYDLSGNVWEWCWDWYGSYASGSQTDPMGAASGTNRVYRGGGWGGSASYARSANRGDDTPSNRNYNIGFRLLRSSSS